MADPGAEHSGPSHAGASHAGTLLVVTGVGGAGKGTIVDELRRRRPDLWWSVSWTTRAARPGEIEGQHYCFVTRDAFEALRDEDGFLEWAEVYGVLKGTPREPVLEALAAGRDVLLEMDIQGAANIRRLFPDAVIVFVTVDGAEQRRRLEERATDSADDIDRRLAAAAAETEAARADGFYIVRNDDLIRAVDEVAAILESRREEA
jgi:guanylate kinase